MVVSSLTDLTGTDIQEQLYLNYQTLTWNFCTDLWIIFRQCLNLPIHLNYLVLEQAEVTELLALPVSWLSRYEHIETITRFRLFYHTTLLTILVDTL